MQFEAPLNLSNVMLVCPHCNQASRVGVPGCRWYQGLACAASAVRQLTKEMGTMQRLAKQYRESILPTMVDEFGYDNVMQVPRSARL